MDLSNIFEVFNQIVFKAMEPYQGSVNMDEGHYTAMQGIIHFIGWSIAIGILIFIFRYMKKHMQEDERMKKYYENKSKDNPKENNLN
jgi:predicted histidine transporter YuiF (NhaC family)